MNLFLSGKNRKIYKQIAVSAFNMKEKIPRSLAFVKGSLGDGEICKWVDWYDVLKNPDKRNVGKFLRSLYGPMNEEAERLRQVREELITDGNELESHFLQGDYYIVSVIGSTIMGDENYEDVDLMIVTNAIWRDMGFLEKILEENTAHDFAYTIDPTISEAYYSPSGRPDRTLVTLQPRQGTGKQIHVVVQPEVSSEAEWNRIDEHPCVVLFRFGNVYGYPGIW